MKTIYQLGQAKKTKQKGRHDKTRKEQKDKKRGATTMLLTWCNKNGIRLRS
jgi:hypothetical protein